MSDRPDTSYIGNPVPGGNGSAKDNSSQASKDKQNSESVVNKGNFSFLYDNSIASPILDIKEGDLKVTKLSNLNNYYYRLGYNYNEKATPTSGKSSAVNRYSANYSQARSVKDKSQWATRDAYKQFKDGTVIANCVGWANGRLWEIWGRALSTKYIKWDASQNSYVFSSNGSKVIGNFTYPNWPPACDAVSFWEEWPNADGWSKSQVPLVGAVVCWGYGGYNGHPGHVAIVEEIHNPGEANEELIISHSSAAPSGSMWLVKLSKIKKSTNYKWYDDHTFKGFLISPVCQLASTNARAMGSMAAGQQIEFDSQTKATYQILINQSSGKTVEKDLPLNANVRITRLGYKKPEGGTIISDRINNIGVNGMIWTKDLTKDYPYGICLPNDPSHTILGYYDWTGLEIISSDTLTEQTVKIVWDDLQTTGVRPDSMVLTLKINGMTSGGKKTSSTRAVTLNPTNEWAVTALGLPKYTEAKSLTEFEWILPSLPIGYFEDVRASINGITAITLKNNNQNIK